MNYKYDYTHNDSDNLTICGMVKFIHEKYPFPSGSMVTWRSNGYDFEFNREYPLMNLTYENDTFLSDNKNIIILAIILLIRFYMVVIMLKVRKIVFYLI